VAGNVEADVRCGRWILGWGVEGCEQCEQAKDNEMLE